MSRTLFSVLEHLSADEISAITDERTFARGRDYYQQGRVTTMTTHNTPTVRLVATVRGTESYKVTVTFADGSLRFVCDCLAWHPMVACKHVVCVLLVARDVFSGQQTIEPEKKVFEATLVREGREQFISFDRALFYDDPSLFWDSFVSEDIIQRKGMMLIPLRRFYPEIANFTATLQQHNIELLINGKKPETATLDVSLEAKSGSGSSDWFDLAPQILADGIELSPEQREELFSRSGLFIETADSIKILNPQSQEILLVLAKMFSMSDQFFSSGHRKSTVVGIPRLRILDLIELRQKGANIRLSREDEELLEGLSNFKTVPKIPVPVELQGTLRTYQQEGYCWLAFLYKNRFGACLADDMGLGKTIQIIAFLGGLAEGLIAIRTKKKLPHLIVLPPTLVFNWQRELQAFYPSLRVHEYANISHGKNFADCDVILTTYDRVRIDTDFFEQQEFHVVVFDEAQAIKNMLAARTAAARKLKSLFTITVTGTPLENHLGEYYSIIDLAVPGLLPQYRHFMAVVKSEDGPAQLIKKTRPFILRRTKELILKDLPEKNESNVLLNMAPSQQKIYATTVAQVKKIIELAYQGKTTAQAQVIALTAIMRLRQICISAELIDPSKEAPSPKIEYAISSLHEIVDEGNAALVFSQFTSCLDLVEKALKKAGLAYYRIDGKTPMPQRKKIVATFQDNTENTAILLLSLKTGGVGLNLTRANYVFHIDPWWNPAVENQASDRSHRIGQKQVVFVNRLVMHHTIEEKMMTLKATKQQLFNDVMEQTATKAKSLISKKDLDLLLS
jgi:SNF2 family DNA or RNA helicase